MADGVDVLIDKWNLEGGNDLPSFMESMKNDESITNILVICDSHFVRKANKREKGVGTESQIMAGEIYGNLKQSRFIPIVCEFDDSGKPYLPVFFESRIWIDFSSNESVNKNWEQLIRLLYGKPEYEKPALGKAPAYITSDDKTPSSPAIGKFQTFKQALFNGKRGLKTYRNDFLEACYIYIDELRVRTPPDVENLGEFTLNTCRKLKTVRDHLIDWVLLESSYRLGFA